jgi:hypothetical protein
MMIHFFSTSAGFWEKVTMMCTLFWDPNPKVGRFLLLELAGRSRPKRKQPGGAAFLLRLVGESVSRVKIGEFQRLKNLYLKSMV